MGNVPGTSTASYMTNGTGWDEFFYNVNIYKQLQEHDLQINLKKRRSSSPRRANSRP